MVRIGWLLKLELLSMRIYPKDCVNLWGIQSFLGYPKVFSGQTLGSDFRVRFSGLTFGLNFRVWKGLQGADDLSAPSCQFSAFISRASSLLRWGLERDGLFRVA